MDLLRGYIKVNNEPILLGCVIILLLSESSNLQFRGVGCGAVKLCLQLKDRNQVCSTCVVYSQWFPLLWILL